MKINIQAVLTEKGRSIYWLAKRTGTTYKSMFNLTRGKSKSLKFSILEKICEVLEVTPNDILIMEEANKKQESDNNDGNDRE
jgi:putative transcriptional regulator